MDSIYLAISFLIAIVLHEWSHGYVSYKLGDPTPKMEDRLTLNPLKHIDIIGLLFLIVARVGWAKPVIINPEYYKNKKWGTVLVSIAGPLMNFILAFFTVILMKIAIMQGLYVGDMLVDFLVTLLSINLSLGIFNLFPIPPLDGSKIWSAFLPEDTYFKFINLGQIGMIIVLILVMTGVLLPILTACINPVFYWMINLFGIF